MNILIFVIILLVLVLVHEFGHFFTAKRFGIRVDEFGFGFPPKLFGIKKGETEYTFNLLPIGGFVKIFGENPDEENMNGPDASRSFVNKPKYQQAIVLFAGIFANFLLAWLLFSIGFMSGLPISVGNEPKGYQASDVHLVVVSVLPGSPAETSGLKSQDKIVYIKSNEFVTDHISPETIKSFVALGNKIEIGYLRGKDTTYNMTEIMPKNENGNLSIGIAMDQIGVLKLPVFKAFWEGMRLDWSVTKDTVVGLYGLIKGALQGKGSFSAVTGPVGMVGIVGDAYQFGFAYLLSFAALISVNLAIINLVPFPALDGGRLLFLLIEKIKGSPMNPKFANTANLVGFALLILLMLFVTYHDVVKLF
jgi:regulator of sigma E protease